MCKAASDGGQRCAAHTRPAYLAAPFGTPEWDRAAAQYATTPTGRRDVEARRDAAAAQGDIETEIACQSALDRAQVLRQATETAQRSCRDSEQRNLAAPTSAVTRPATPQACLDLARQAHGTQQYGTRPYVEAHVEPVGRLLAPYGPDAEMTGYLHDIVEDTTITLDDLAVRGVPDHVIQAVDGMTKRRHETKEQAAIRARDTSPLSRLGKLADNTANRLGLDTLARTDPDKANRLRPKYTAVRDILLTDPDGTHNENLAEIADAMEAAWRADNPDAALTPDTAHKAVAAFFLSDDGAPYQSVCDEQAWARGMCVEVSEALAQHLTANGHPDATTVDLIATSDHPYLPAGTSHTVVQVRGTVLDLTHTQFDPDAPVPLVESADSFLQGWRVVH